MKIWHAQPGQRYSLNVWNTETEKPGIAVFTVVDIGIYPAHKTTSGPAPFDSYPGAMTFLDNGHAFVVDPVTADFCQPLLCLPRPADVAA